MNESLLNFDQILGQTSAIESLTNSYKAERLPHAMIFAGPHGVGKATTARALGALFLCEKPQQLSPCGKCPSCLSFAAGNHPDFHVIYRQLARIEKEERKARDLSAEVIRDYLIARAAKSSIVGVGKVFVIEEADLMTSTAQNALLKTLEEPAGRTLIILLTDQPDALLPTIRSRCRTVQFAALEQSLVREQLQKRKIAKTIAASAARYSEGSLGLALRWIEDGVIDLATDLTQRLEKIVAGKSAADLQAWFKPAADAYAEKQLARDPLASKDQAVREGLVLYLKLCAQYFRQQLIQQKDDPEALERLCAAIDAVVQSEGYIESNVNTSLVFQQFTVALDAALRPTAAV